MPFDNPLNRYTVKPPKSDRIGDWKFGPCREAGPISEVYLQIYCMSLNNPPHNASEHKNNHVTMNFTMIMSQFAWPFLLFCTLFFEVATTYQSYRASLILAFTGCLASVYSASWGIRFNKRQD